MAIGPQNKFTTYLAPSTKWIEKNGADSVHDAIFKLQSYNVRDIHFKEVAIEQPISWKDPFQEKYYTRKIAVQLQIDSEMLCQLVRDAERGKPGNNPAVIAAFEEYMVLRTMSYDQSEL
jgi:hypothetical protein